MGRDCITMLLAWRGMYTGLGAAAGGKSEGHLCWRTIAISIENLKVGQTKIVLSSLASLCTACTTTCVRKCPLL